MLRYANAYNRRKLNMLQPTALDYARLERDLGDFSGVLKMYMSACNNATFLVLGNALDAMRKHPVWKVKFHKAKGKFMQAMKEWKLYESRLLYAKTNRMFHLADYSEEVRKKYGNITDREYYDFWCTIGSFAYQHSLNELNSLKHKYKKALDAHGVEGSESLSEAMLALMCLNCCLTMLDVQLNKGSEEIKISKNVLEYFFGDFSLVKVRDAWEEALMLTEPEFMQKDLDPVEDRNIQLGITQLAERWADEKMLYHAVNDATEDYQEVFRTEGEWKKALRMIRETRKTLK